MQARMRRVGVATARAGLVSFFDGEELYEGADALEVLALVPEGDEVLSEVSAHVSRLSRATVEGKAGSVSQSG